MTSSGRNNTVIGVVAATGDLGGQICVQAVANGQEVLAYARNPEAKIKTITGMDLVTRVRSVNARVHRVDLGELIERSEIIHWCAPLDALVAIESIPEDAVIVLHDSVMARSLAAKNDLLARLPEAQIAIVHCLMNNERTVVVANGHDDGRVAAHFKDLAMNVKHLDTHEHDLLMAHSQAPLAILCKLLLDDLNTHHNDGLLTNSGQALRRALIDRSAQWTPATLEAILDNPELPQLISAMERTILTDKV